MAGRGRPKIGVIVTMRMPDGLLKAVDRLAQGQRAEWLRAAVTRCVEQGMTLPNSKLAKLVAENLDEVEEIVRRLRNER